ncbi:MAG: hypothetical protein E5X67_21340 [Mesorhizobium sp.]|uniref:hypothetical protein n=1 Tax=Mesorhizobium sp. TaxID=1871066 RepID=UPI00120DF3F2|nr:hypothetical protein [Mesorhizobium sp.]TIP26210.1 MAG: hypothetical protein E5X67_21340 [Mesorhizobium sp.]
MNKLLKDTSPAQSLEPIFAGIQAIGLSRYPLLAVFFSGNKLPGDCVPMARTPMPFTDFLFDKSFPKHLSAALHENESIHDGAVLFGRVDSHDLYRCSGWSFRIVAKHQPSTAEANRGSAYNSAISLSGAPRIDCVCLFTESDFEVFVAGKSFRKSG